MMKIKLLLILFFCHSLNSENNKNFLHKYLPIFSINYISYVLYDTHSDYTLVNNKRKNKVGFYTIQIPKNILKIALVAALNCYVYDLKFGKLLFKKNQPL